MAAVAAVQFGSTGLSIASVSPLVCQLPVALMAGRIAADTFRPAQMDPDNSSDQLTPSDVDRITFGQWQASRNVARATAFRLLKVSGITPHKMKVPGSRALVNGLDPEMVATLDQLEQRLANGETMAQLEASTTHALAPLGRSETVATDAPATAPTTDAAALLQRLQALDLAIATGSPLSTAEVALLLGARPGGPVVTRGRVMAERHGRNCWTVSAADLV